MHQDIAKPQISEITHQGSGRAPTAYEARTAFLQLFGGRELFQIPQASLPEFGWFGDQICFVGGVLQAVGRKESVLQASLVGATPVDV